MLMGYLALTIAALFTGAAFYINVAEQPARLKLEDRPLLTQWKTAYGRGVAMQASLAVLGFVLGALAWWQTGRLAFLAGAFSILANWPWTLIAMMPTNKTLMATDPDKAGTETRALIIRWNGLHLVRTVLGALAVVCFIFAVSAA